MGSGKGLGLVALLGLALFLSKDRKLTAQDFYPTFNGAPQGAPSITYSQYFQYVTRPETELEEGEAFIEQTTIGGKTGRWLTIGGRIPTPSGGLIPLPTIHVGRVAVEKMLQPIEEAIEESHFQDVAGRRSVNLRLQPL